MMRTCVLTKGWSVPSGELLGEEMDSLLLLYHAVFGEDAGALWMPEDGSFAPASCSGAPMDLPEIPELQVGT